MKFMRWMLMFWSATVHKGCTKTPILRVYRSVCLEKLMYFPARGYNTFRRRAQWYQIPNTKCKKKSFPGKRVLFLKQKLANPGFLFLGRKYCAFGTPSELTKCDPPFGKPNAGYQMHLCTQFAHTLTHKYIVLTKLPCRNNNHESYKYSIPKLETITIAVTK